MRRLYLILLTLAFAYPVEASRDSTRADTTVLNTGRALPKVLLGRAGRTGASASTQVSLQLAAEDAGGCPAGSSVFDRRLSRSLSTGSPPTLGIPGTVSKGWVTPRPV